MKAPIVLKFGGSFLRGHADLVRAVHVIYREVREGRPVVAVTSAFHGRTDELERSLFALDAERGVRSSERTRAALLQTGELETANLLSAALDRSGVPSRVLEVPRFGPFVEPGTEDPTHVDASGIERLLKEYPVLCIPGFAAAENTPERGPALLGRGGSDMTAMVLGRDLSATVRLVKDVEGLYTSDPARKSADQGTPRRLARVAFQDALSLGPDILQPRALRFARRHGLEFEVVGPGHVAGVRGTRVGELPTASRSTPSPPQPLRVALLGLGTVGARVFAELQSAPDRFEVVSVLVRSIPGRERPAAARSLLTESFEDVLLAAPDLIVEATGGLQPAADHLRTALGRGIHVVTANKVAAAKAAPSLEGAAAQGGAMLLTSAAVGGALPALETVARIRSAKGGDPLVGIEGVFNGTSNAVLDALSEGRPMADAIRDAQGAGLAEADPTDDLDGTDIAHKIELLARAAGWPAPRWLHQESIERLGPDGPGRGLKLEPKSHLRARFIGSVFFSDVGPVASVSLQLVGEDCAFHGVNGSWNAALLHFESGATQTITGRGAGPWPTATATMGDVYAISRRIALGEFAPASTAASERNPKVQEKDQ